MDTIQPEAAQSIYKRFTQHSSNNHIQRPTAMHECDALWIGSMRCMSWMQNTLASRRYFTKIASHVDVMVCRTVSGTYAHDVLIRIALFPAASSAVRCHTSPTWSDPMGDQPGQAQRTANLVSDASRQQPLE